MVKSQESWKRIMGRSWEQIGKPWENDEKIRGSWKNHGKIMGKIVAKDENIIGTDWFHISNDPLE